LLFTLECINFGHKYFKMGYIKYKRIYGKYTDEQLQLQLDELIAFGWEIISYSETILVGTATEVSKLIVTMIVGKRNQAL